MQCVDQPSVFLHGANNTSTGHMTLVQIHLDFLQLLLTYLHRTSESGLFSGLAHSSTNLPSKNAGIALLVFCSLQACSWQRSSIGTSLNSVLYSTNLYTMPSLFIIKPHEIEGCVSADNMGHYARLRER